MRKQILSALLAGVLMAGMSTSCLAAEAAGNAPAAADATATNLKDGYPAPEQVAPPRPVPPASMNKPKEVAAYIAAVDQYVKAMQKYIDGTTNDLNSIVEKRNKAGADTNKVIEEYNNFFGVGEKK